MHTRAIYTKTTLFLVLLVGLPAGSASAQPVSVSHIADSNSAALHVIRKIPKGFHVVDKWKSWIIGYSWHKRNNAKEWQKDAYDGENGLLLQSDDKQCEVLYAFTPSTLYYFPEVADRARNAIWYDLLSIHHGKEDFRLDDHVTAIGGRKPKELFNADSIFLFDIQLQPLDQDGELYMYCTKMYLSRKGRLPMIFVWFFTDRGIERKEEYMRALAQDKNVWYKNGEWDNGKFREEL